MSMPKIAHNNDDINITYKCKMVCVQVQSTDLDLHFNTAVYQMLRVDPVIRRCQLNALQRTKIVRRLWHSGHVWPAVSK